MKLFADFLIYIWSSTWRHECGASPDICTDGKLEGDSNWASSRGVTPTLGDDSKNSRPCCRSQDLSATCIHSNFLCWIFPSHFWIVQAISTPSSLLLFLLISEKTKSRLSEYFRSFASIRLGFLVDFLSHAAIVGFMAGAAIVIGLQQLKGLLGISHFTAKTDVVSVLESVFKSLHHPVCNAFPFPSIVSILKYIALFCLFNSSSWKYSRELSVCLPMYRIEIDDKEQIKLNLQF